MSHSSSVSMQAQALLALREHSQKELVVKLYKRGVPQDVALETVQKLAKAGLQCDTRYASAYIESRLSRGYGPVYIRNALTEKGVSNEIVEALLLPLQSTWLARAKQVWQKKFNHFTGDNKQQLKQKRFIYSRGFELATIKSLFHQLKEHNER